MDIATRLKGYFTLGEAAAYCNLSEAGLRYHIYVSRKLVADVTIGTNLLFKRQTLDNFLIAKKLGLEQEHGS